MWKLDLKDSCFCISLGKSSRKYVRFQWAGNLFEFIYLCFGLEPALRTFTELMKIPISLHHGIYILMIIYVHGILILWRTMEYAQMNCQTQMNCQSIILILQGLRFVTNQSYFQLILAQVFLGMNVNLMKMALSLSRTKTENIKEKFLGLSQKSERTTILK